MNFLTYSSILTESRAGGKGGGGKKEEGEKDQCDKKEQKMKKTKTNACFNIITFFGDLMKFFSIPANWPVDV